jgi:hypothetical protein
LVPPSLAELGNRIHGDDAEISAKGHERSSARPHGVPMRFCIIGVRRLVGRADRAAAASLLYFIIPAKDRRGACDKSVITKR